MTKRAGFTLIELLAVMAIIAILAGLILGVSSYAGRKAAEARAVAEMEKIKTACEEYKIDYGAYPISSSIETLSNYVSDLTYVGSTIEDPWGNSYGFNIQSFGVEVISAGQDGQTNTVDDLSTAKSNQ